jgi:hypothetical protein
MKPRCACDFDGFFKAFVAQAEASNMASKNSRELFRELCVRGAGE